MVAFSTLPCFNAHACCSCAGRNYHTNDVAKVEPSRLCHATESPSPLIKPDTDRLQYKFVQLSNGLKALLICDPEADKAAAALDVNVGSLADPDNIAGLAHFTEHMLFYSSEKYPVEDEYSKFISDHGGHTNAYTAAESTNYQFDINWDHLEPALDRFAQFFISPLISGDGVDRELKAVDSEHGKNLNSDAWRQLQLCKLHANQSHPWSKFSTGNLETLSSQPKAQGVDVRQAVVEFHKTHYSANLMRLVVYGRQPLPQLEAWVVDKFSAVPTAQLPPLAVSPDVYDMERIPLLLKMVPQRSAHVLEVAWQVPPSAPQHASQPLGYLSHLLGHEGAGSVFALLKARGWASSLVAGESGSSMSAVSFFYIRLELTDLGQTHAREAGQLIFRYLALLREPGGICPLIYEEWRALQLLRFNFRDKLPPYQYTTSLADAMQHYPDSHLLTALYHVPQVFDPAAISAALSLMTPERCLVMWQSNSWKGATDSTERWYGTPYSAQPLPQDWLEAWSQAGTEEGLHLPAPNPFVPTDFELYAPEPSPTPPHADHTLPTTTITPASSGEPTKQCSAAGGAPPVTKAAPEGVDQLLALAAADPVPVVAVSSPLMRLHWRLDTQFQVPKAVIALELQCPAAYTCPEHAVMTRLFVRLVCDYLNELTYPAELAGLAYSCVNTLSGFKVEVSGYHHKLRLLADMLLNQVVHFQVREDRFAIIAEAQMKEYRNMAVSQPYSWAMYRRETLLQSRRWQVDEYLQVLPAITPDMLQRFHGLLLSRVFIEGLAVGNIRRSDVEQLAGRLEELLGATHLNTRPCLQSQAKDWRTVALPQGVTCRMSEPGPNPQNDNSAVVVVYQVGPDSPRRNALLSLLVQLAKRDAFHELRTQQQLGYIVSLFSNHEFMVQHLELVIQSNAFNAVTLVDRVETFIRSWVSDLPQRLAADPALLPAAVSELSKSLLDRPKRLSELAGQLWKEVYYGTLRFKRQVEEVMELQAITAQELQTFALQVLADCNTRRKLVVQVKGHNALEEGEAGNICSPLAPPQPVGEQSADAAGTCGAPLSDKGDGASHDGGAAGLTREKVLEISDVAAFKRGCSLYPNVADGRMMGEAIARL